MLAAAGDGVVRFGAEARAVGTDGAVGLATGERLEAEVIVGADGINSATRGALLGDGPPRASGVVAYRAVVDDWGGELAVVGSSQPNVRVKIGPNGFPDESDFGGAPIPPRTPNEGGSTDAHVIVVDRDACELFELYVAHYKGGVGNRWRADSTARFDLTSTKLREDGFTSADAAGLSIFPGLTRYDEVASGEIDHALRITFGVTRRAYLNPATHYASKVCNSAAPAMGLRLRLRANYPEGGLGPQSKVIVKALKTYGVINADNGRNWFLSGTSDKRWDHDDLGTLKKIDGIDFEVVRSADKPHTDC